MLSKREISKILDFMDVFDENNLSKLHCKQKKFGILISDKNPKATKAVHSVAVEKMASFDTPIQVDAGNAFNCSNNSSAEANSTQANNASSAHQIIAPMTGSYYSRPKPEDPAFAKVGDIVEAGSVLCLLEAMKMFNEIKSDVKGKVLKANFKDGDFASENDVLFEIQPM